MNSTKNENPTALRGQRLDDGLDLPQRLSCMQLRFDIAVPLQQLKVRDRFETHHLVAPGVVDHQIAGDREQVGAPRRHIFPIFGGVGTSHDLGYHIVQLMGGRQDPSKPAAKCGFLRQNNSFEPVQLGANTMHVDPLDVSRASPAFFYLSQFNHACRGLSSAREAIWTRRRKNFATCAKFHTVARVSLVEALGPTGQAGRNQA